MENIVSIVKTDNKLAKLTLKQDVISQEERAGTIRIVHTFFRIQSNGKK